MKKFSAGSASADNNLHHTLPPMSDRMRKRKAFADKELDDVMMQRELSLKCNASVHIPRKIQNLGLHHPALSQILTREASCILPSTSLYSSFNISPYSAFLRVPSNKTNFQATGKETTTFQNGYSPSPGQTPPRLGGSPKSFPRRLSDDFYYNSTSDDNISHHCSPPNVLSMDNQKGHCIDSLNNQSQLSRNNVSSGHESRDNPEDMQINQEKASPKPKDDIFLPGDNPNIQHQINMLAMMFPQLEQKAIHQSIFEIYHGKTQIPNHLSSVPPLCCSVNLSKNIISPTPKPYNAPNSSFLLSDFQEYRERLVQFYLQQIQAQIPLHRSLLENQHQFSLNNFQKLCERKHVRLLNTLSSESVKPLNNSGSAAEKSRPSNDEIHKRRRMSSSDSGSSSNTDARKLSERFLENQPDKYNAENYHYSLQKPCKHSFSKPAVHYDNHQPHAEIGLNYSKSPSKNNDRRFRSNLSPSFYSKNLFSGKVRNDKKLNPFSVQSIIGKAKA